MAEWLDEGTPNEPEVVEACDAAPHATDVGSHDAEDPTLEGREPAVGARTPLDMRPEPGAAAKGLFPLMRCIRSCRLGCVKPEKPWQLDMSRSKGFRVVWTDLGKGGRLTETEI